MASRELPHKVAVQAWYDEVNNWEYGVGSTNRKMVGHFTQVVWYRSHQLGCAMAHCPEARLEYYYVCHYCGPGNTQFRTPYKEGPSCGGCPNDCEDRLCTNSCPYYDKASGCDRVVTSQRCSAHESLRRVCRGSCNCSAKII